MDYEEYPTEMANSAAQGPHKQTQPTKQIRSTAEIENLLAQQEVGRQTSVSNVVEIHEGLKNDGPVDRT